MREEGKEEREEDRERKEKDKKRKEEKEGQEKKRGKRKGCIPASLYMKMIDSISANYRNHNCQCFYQ